MIEAIVCDFGGVLTTPLEDAFAAHAEHSGISNEDLGAAIFAVAERNGANPLYELETGRMTESDFLQLVAGELQDRLQRELDITTFADIYWQHLHPNTELIEYVRSLRHERGYRTALLTNNVREWRPRWEAMIPVDELFELVVDSSEVGLRKPDPAIYTLTVDRLGLAPEACLLIDDFAHNCEAAVAEGMRAVHFRETAQAIAEIEAAIANSDDAQVSVPSRSQT